MIAAAGALTAATKIHDLPLSQNVGDRSATCLGKSTPLSEPGERITVPVNTIFYLVNNFLYREHWQGMLVALRDNMVRDCLHARKHAHVIVVNVILISVCC